jgi:diguanylate cyclase (GGDEF)-like protein
MDLTKIKGFAIRHKVQIQDLSVLVAVLLVMAFIAFEVDIFVTEGTVAESGKKIELDELLLLGGLLSLGLLLFSIRRYLEQKREAFRRFAAEQEVRVLAFQDALTGLPNRRQFDSALKAAIAALPRAGAVHCLFLLDLNGFKQINDVHGHSTGDQVLVTVAQRLAATMGDSALVARLGGDEFAILALHLVGPEAATTIALRAAAALDEPILVGSLRHQASAGIGMALIPTDADTVQEAMRKADVALYRAKTERRTALRFFEQDMDRLLRERALIERALRAALGNGGIEVVFQPSVNLLTRQVVGFEARPRWTHDELGDIPADRFIPIAEEVGLIHELAERLLRQACEVAVQWPVEVTLSVDLFAGQLADRNLGARIMHTLQQTGFAAHRLEIEITESVLVQHLEAAQEILGGLRLQGVRIALDNFGTGYSSLYHLRNFKLDKIKIDRSFIERMDVERESAEIVNALVGLGRGLGVIMSAEGIDDLDQRSALLGTGCELGQGFLFSEPVSAAATRGLVDNQAVVQ